MVEFFVKLILLIGVAFTVIMSYYNGVHMESSSGYAGYAIAIIIIYAAYKFAKTSYSKNNVEFSLPGLAGMALLHILVLCMSFFSLNGMKYGTSALFFKIVGFLILPTIIVFISYSFARSILLRIPSFKNETTPFKFTMSLGLGFVLFTALLSLASFFGIYNFTSVFVILLAFAALGAKELWNSMKSFYTYRISFPKHNLDGTFFDALNLRLLSAEFAFIIMTFLIGVNFINIVRPMPIGWDDLGAYMNFPQIMANSSAVLKGAGMLSWHLFTGIGFMFHSAPQAFFFNQVGGVLSLIVLMVVFSDLLDNGKKKFIALPIILATMFYAMPMVIFQQAKDMKLDPGLFFISVIGIYLIYNLFSRYLGFSENTNNNDLNPGTASAVSSIPETNPDKKINDSVLKAGNQTIFDNKDYLWYLFIAGAIVGFAFTIKVTTLMLILGILGVILYSMLGYSGFLGYFFIFIGVFSRFGLWEMMNISYPKDNISLVHYFGYANIALGLSILAYSFMKYKAKSFISALLLTAVFLGGVLAPLAPWLTKNYLESKPNFSIGALLNGQSDGFVADLTKIYSKEEIKKIQDKTAQDAVSAKGQTQNEDFGRYFGYEDGLNNYLKLPWNLTLQKNQAGEYTEITYFFLALLPAILLFLPYKNIALSFGMLLPIVFGIEYFGNFALTQILVSTFAKLNLPGGYFYIIGLFLLVLAYFAYSLKNDKLSQLFKLNATFLTMYLLIFIVAAFGIVWYGIAMYFSFLLMIGIGASFIVEEKEDELENLSHFFGSFMLMVIISIYFFMSTIPHGFNNLKQASFADYKAGLYNQEEGIFASHPDYFKVLANLNINDSDKYASDVMNSVTDPILKKIMVSNIGEKPEIAKIESILREIRTSDLIKLGLDSATANKTKILAANKLNEIYKTVLYSPKDLKNDGKIYRIGTFLTYFIDNNRKRYYDDSLITNFDKYFYRENPDETVENMKKVGLKYLLVDLNAATIDKDPRHDLTRRFEELLQTFKSKKLELVQTDSLCLQMALDENNADYLTYAGVNYESYTASGQTISRGQKQLQCYNHILELIRTDKISDTSYPYLKNLSDYFKSSNVQDQNKALQIFQQYVNHGWLALFKIK